MVKAITYILKNDANVLALVGLNAVSSKAKIYPMYATQKEDFPLVTVWEMSRVGEQCKERKTTSFRYGYDIHAFALSYDAVTEICEAIEDALEDANVTSPINGVQFTTKIVNTNRRDGAYLEDYKVYSKILSFEATVNEGQAT